MSRYLAARTLAVEWSGIRVMFALADEIPGIVNLGIGQPDFETPDHSMRLASVHPGVSVEEVVENTGFELVIPDAVPETRAPSAEDLRIIREVLDPDGIAAREVNG